MDWWTALSPDVFNSQLFCVESVCFILCKTYILVDCIITECRKTFPVVMIMSGIVFSCLHSIK